jgi:hypothetical protein
MRRTHIIGFVQMDFLPLARWIAGRAVVVVHLGAGESGDGVTRSSGPLYSESEPRSLLDPWWSLPFILLC